MTEPVTTADLALIQRVIPHRYPFLLIDRLEQIVPHKSAVGIKNITFNEPQFQGHFPGQPIFPGVMIIEAMAQTAAAMVGISLELQDKNALVYFMGVEKAKFRRKVVPGDVLELHVTALRGGSKVWKFDGVAKVGDDRPQCRSRRLSAQIHPTAVIEPGAEIGEGCVIGAFCVVGPQVRLAPRVTLRSHVVVTGQTEIGEDTTIFSFAVIGEIPQDLKYSGEPTRLVIGARNRIREHVTMNTGTEGGGGVTTIGDDGLYMAGCHIAHDAHIGDRVIVVNSAAVAGHCVIEDDVLIGGLCGIHQFVRIGRGAIIGAVTMVTKDVIPYGLVQAPRGELDGLNLVGLKRRGVPRTDITALRAAYQTLAQGEGAFMDRARRLADEHPSHYVQEISEFVLAATDRSFLTPR